MGLLVVDQLGAEVEPDCVVWVSRPAPMNLTALPAAIARVPCWVVSVDAAAGYIEVSPFTTAREPERATRIPVGLAGCAVVGAEG